MTTNDYCQVYKEDLLDMAKFCQAALAQDSPEDPYFYLNKLLGYITGHLTSDQRLEIEEYLANKDYLPPVELIL
jgi:hypothetical protein|tara:strand:- start:341 stop:562 length:222 start_codon:yes stop_codon:yes gene_type:complete